MPTALFKTLIDLYIMVLLLRIWMQWTRCDFYNPFSQLIVKITQPVIGPLRRVIPALGPLDSASLLLALILAMIKFPLLMLIEVHVLILDPIFLLVGLLALLKAADELVFWVVIIRSLLSWVSQGRSPMDVVLYQLTEPLMYPIRRILPAMGGIDFSAMVVILILYALNYLGMSLFPGIW
ncbi:Integral membrane protein YggT involved in response to extracytoplasmic stress (osmotic shock) [Candidatus Sodalis pierantonius str. SOPE]|uniref:Integral membrane protein YggT involved in response to extracytoplasmic stress (Osmotic shock) n=1 Tax=Candidatus Sodalis pierantonii str. SOPE TaxID=2342 RepID=W0HR36_9GAMM|nr:YggT family protein [Candidatus Sodalis pierantonius]AHF74962.1 Integral membrane protein YggT involved in response to extracytoplasmic stress (osmotic shock) [Candidatus Sodalis pierantonius str. SOPE]